MYQRRLMAYDVSLQCGAGNCDHTRSSPVEHKARSRHVQETTFVMQHATFSSTLIYHQAPSTEREVARVGETECSIYAKQHEMKWTNSSDPASRQTNQTSSQERTINETLPHETKVDDMLSQGRQVDGTLPQERKVDKTLPQDRQERETLSQDKHIKEILL